MVLCWGRHISRNSSNSGQIEAKAYSLAPELQKYFSALYCFRSKPTLAGSVNDCVYPDWAGLHFIAEGKASLARIGDGQVHHCADFAANGPTIRAMHIQSRAVCSWSFAISPIGWSRYAGGAARDVANVLVDGSTHPTFSRLAPVLEIVREAPDDFLGTARRIESFLRDNLDGPGRHEAQVSALHDGLRDPAVGEVEQLVRIVGISRRTLERLALRFFGFSPKTLLRRQRFLRSLGKFTIDPQRNWSSSLDGQYVDQAHFVRDFRSFMGMTPSEYARMPHPILEGIITRRLAEQGAHSG